MPGGEVGGEEQAAQRAGADQGPARKGPAAALPHRHESQERQGQGQPPEARSHRPDIGQPHHPRPGGEKQVGEQERREGEAVRTALMMGDDGIHGGPRRHRRGLDGVRQAPHGVTASARCPPIAPEEPATDSAFRIATLYLLRRSIPAGGPLPMPSLFGPIQLGAVAAPNRALMAPLTRGRATREHVPTELMRTYYAQRAGAGLILTEATGISRAGTGLALRAGHLERRAGRGLEAGHRGGARSRRSDLLPAVAYGPARPSRFSRRRRSRSRPRRPRRRTRRTPTTAASPMPRRGRFGSTKLPA